MTTQPTADHGQKLAPPQGKVIGFIDGQAKFDAFAEDVRAAGYPADKITALFGEDGVRLLERLKSLNFFFGDSEDSMIHQSIHELSLGHYAAAVDVVDHKQAEQIASLAKPHGGHNFSYFGLWVTQQISS